MSKPRPLARGAAPGVASTSQEQVLTRTEDYESEIAAEYRELGSGVDPPLGVVSSSLVIRGLLPTHAPDSDHELSDGHQLGGNQASRPSTPKTPKKKKRRGGWQASSRLRWRADIREIYEIVHELAAKGYALTHFITVTPRSGNAQLRKRMCSRVVAHLGQKLKRQGHDHFGITIIEHPLDADLHAHHLVYVPRSEAERIERWRCPTADIDFRRITRLDPLLAYLLKQRRRLSPEFEGRIKARNGPRWQRCRPVPGKRWSMTTAVKELLNFR